jgi:hypothetical protein
LTSDFLKKNLSTFGSGTITYALISSLFKEWKDKPSIKVNNVDITDYVSDLLELNALKEQEIVDVVKELYSLKDEIIISVEERKSEIKNSQSEEHISEIGNSQLEEHKSASEGQNQKVEHSQSGVPSEQTEILSSTDYVWNFHTQMKDQYERKRKNRTTENEASIKKEYLERNSSFYQNCFSQKDAINAVISNEYTILMTALKEGKQYDKMEKAKKEFTAMVNKQFEDAWNHKTKFSADMIAATLYNKLTKATLDYGQVETSGKSFWVHADHLDNNISKENLSKDENKQANKTMSNDLINYLYGFKNPTKLFLIGTLNDPVKTDRRAIDRFVGLVNNITVLDGVAGSVEGKLLNYFKTYATKIASYTTENWKDALQEMGMTLNKRKLDSLQKVAHDYVNAYRESTKDNLPYYKVVLDEIARNGSIANTYLTYKSEVEDFKQNIKQYTISSEKALKKLEEQHSELLPLTKALDIPADNVYRLSQLDASYFQGQDIAKILADFNFDKDLTHADRGKSKMGLEFYDVYDRQLNSPELKHKALENILEVAKRRNAALPSEIRLNPDTITLDAVQQ